MDLYRGFAGLQAAWARVVYWLTVEIPDQWEQLNAILQSLGGSAPGGVPVQQVDTSVTVRDPADDYTRDRLTPAQQTLCDTWVNNWRVVWSTFHAPISLGAWSNFRGGVNDVTVAVHILGWNVWHLASGRVETAPADYVPPASDGAVQWHYGEPGGHA